MVEIECNRCHARFPMVFKGKRLTCPECGEVLMWVGTNGTEPPKPLQLQVLWDSGPLEEAQP